MQQVVLLLVVKEYFENGVKDTLLDHVLDTHGILHRDDRLEELDNLHICLDRFIVVALGHFHLNFLVHEEHAKLIWVNIVDYELVEELND